MLRLTLVYMKKANILQYILKTKFSHSHDTASVLKHVHKLHHPKSAWNQHLSKMKEEWLRDCIWKSDKSKWVSWCKMKKKKNETFALCIEKQFPSFDWWWYSHQQLPYLQHPWQDSRFVQQAQELLSNDSMRCASLRSFGFFSSPTRSCCICLNSSLINQ